MNKEIILIGLILLAGCSESYYVNLPDEVSTYCMYICDNGFNITCEKASELDNESFSELKEINCVLDWKVSIKQGVILK